MSLKPSKPRDSLLARLAQEQEANHDFQLEKTKISQLIPKFFNLLKSMLFLGILDKIDDYFREFEQILKDKNYNWKKLSYIKLLFDFRNLHKKRKIKDQEIVDLYKQIYSIPKLCIHDHRMIVLILESFMEPRFLSLLIKYLDQNIEKLALIYTNVLFLSHSYDKFNEVVQKLMFKIQNHKFFTIENYAFMHQLNAPNILQIDKNLSFSFYKRIRYEVLRDVQLKQIFLKYIPKNQLINFYLRFSIFYGIVYRVRKNTPSEDIIRIFYDELQQFLPKVPEIFRNSNFLYEILLLCYTMNFSNKTNDLASIIVSIIDYLVDFISIENYYHFSIIRSLIGNIFYKNELFDQSYDQKIKAFELIKKIDSQKNFQFPKYLKRINKNEYIYSILSFITLIYFRKKNLEQAEKFIRMIKNNPYYLTNKTIELIFYDFLKFYILDVKDQMEKCLTHALEFNNKETNELKKDLYDATIQNLKLNFMRRHSNPEEIEQQRRKSRKSVGKLYEDIIKDN